MDTPIPKYRPDASEMAIYEALWRAANPTNLPELGGQAVVPFFLKSKVDKGILKQIWTFSCGQSLSMQQDQFYTALRFIVMVQNGELPVTKGNNLKYLFTFGKKKHPHMSCWFDFFQYISSIILFIPILFFPFPPFKLAFSIHLFFLFILFVTPFHSLIIVLFSIILYGE